MAYWSQTDLEGLMGQQMVLNCFQDGGTGVVNQTYLAEDQALADAEVDGAIATEYPNIPLPIFQVFPTWQASTTYQVGAMVIPTAASIYAFRAVAQPGKSGLVEPTWPTQYATTVPDGTALWICVSRVPQLIRKASMLWGRVFAFQRHRDYAREFGAGAREEAEANLKKLMAAKRFFADYQTKILPSNVGGVTVDNGARLYVDNADGTTNSGDF